MKHLVTSALVLAGVLATVNAARGQEPSPAPFQVVRLGDSQLACEALVTEINGLNGQMQSMQTAMSDRAMQASQNAMRAARGPGRGASTAMSLGTMAASMIPGAGLFAGAASQVAAAAQAAQAQAAQNRAMEDMEAMTAEMTTSASAMGPISQRVEHLSEISRSKGC
jgi:hypothetical protein